MKEDIPYYLSVLPTEIVLYIFTYLTAKELIKCRQVCIRFKQIVDELTRSDALWREYCKKNYPTIYKIARYKSKPDLLWYNIFKSLTLWPKLADAKEDWDEFASASSVNEEISNFQILRDGVIGVHKREAIIYYDIESLERAKREAITGDYLKYKENDDTIVILSYHLQLFVIHKNIQNPRFETNVTFDNIKTFILEGEEVYYVTLNDDIYVCRLKNLSTELLEHTDEGIMSLGYCHNRLRVLTLQRHIYTYNGKNLVFTCLLGPDKNLLNLLYKYSFLDTVDWKIYNQWMYVLNRYIPEGPLRDIITVRVYGEVVFVGSNWGVLRIYYSPFTGGEFDLYNSEPIKQYNFTERSDCPVLSMCPIVQIDVSESEDGHMVIVAMPKKIAVLRFTHNFKRTASVAMLPYENAQTTKALKIEDGA
ncbi:unnamed protein product [Parnassius apollo]|uniref:(apollo) hypothetical protein n=1 Tax=Parnassius apollo TaxID=110799 RepID=A0A8S3X440_PARAO|nr:unnamed protein product [Parnassius apollo]